MKVDHEYKSIPHQSNHGLAGRVVPAEVVKIENDYQKIHDAYMRAIASGDSLLSRLIAARYRKHCESRK